MAGVPNEYRTPGASKLYDLRLWILVFLLAFLGYFALDVYVKNRDILIDTSQDFYWFDTDSSCATLSETKNLKAVSWLEFRKTIDWDRANHSRVLEGLGDKDDQPTRVQRIRQVCDGFNLTSRPLTNTSQLFLDAKHNHVHCIVSKCGSSNIERSLIILVTDEEQLAGLGPKWDPHSLLKFTPEKFNVYNISRHPNQYELTNAADYRVIYVRHPFARLTSAYLHKIVEYLRGNLQAYHLKRFINKSYRPDFQAKDIDSVPTFSQFVDYVLDAFLEAEDIQWANTLDLHWIPITRLCEPCLVNYDAVVKLETLTSDINYLNQRIWNETMQYVTGKGERNSSRSNSKTPDLFKELNKMQIEKLTHLYADDFLLFGYDPVIPS